ncbi:hypothetical protein LZ31DRAFT_167691 [Colletotrichum somersetense]|nr:hypothetical protein LZ31DRAFT_167691 [Colletotrichum somersetense]
MASDVNVTTPVYDPTVVPFSLHPPEMGCAKCTSVTPKFGFALRIQQAVAQIDRLGIQAAYARIGRLLQGAATENGHTKHTLTKQTALASYEGNSSINTFSALAHPHRSVIIVDLVSISASSETFSHVPQKERKSCRNASPRPSVKQAGLGEPLSLQSGKPWT